MIGFEIDKEFLEVSPDATLQVVVQNPLFNEETETGLVTYDLALKQSKQNQKLTGYTAQLNRTSAPAAINCNLWLLNQFFRVGKLNVLEGGSKEVRVNFQSDAGAMAAAKDDWLSELDLGMDNLSLSVKGFYPVDNYALFPVKNAGFYGGTNTSFKKYLNYYQGIFRSNSTTNDYAIVPFPYLAYILKKVFAHYGFTITGTWINEAETNRLVIFNTYALDLLAGNGINQYQTGIDFRHHVPKIKVAEFLKDVRTMLGLSFFFSTNASEVEIVRRADVLADPDYTDWSAITVPAHTWQPNDRNGFVLEQKDDSSDSEQKLILDKLKYQTGAGKDTIATGCSYPDCRIITDEIHGTRQWLVPVTDQKGNSPEFELGTENSFSFRLLQYHGLQPDSDAGNYPMGSFSGEDMTGLNISSQSLAWGGAKGLYQLAYKNWLEFLGEADTIVLPVALSVADLSLLDPRRKVLIRTESGTVKAFWQKIEFDVHARLGIRTAKVTFYKVRN